MKSKISLLLSSLFALNAHAVIPVEGLYYNFSIGGYYQPKLKQIALPAVSGVTDAASTPDLTNNFGGQGAFGFGYRFYKRYRIETQIFGNGFNPKALILNGSKIAPTTDTKLKGTMYNIGGLINAYVDFFPSARQDGSAYSPYFGLGFGIAYAHTELLFNSSSSTTTTNSGNKSVKVAQGIVGISYWADDFTTVALEYRLQDYGKLTALNASPRSHSINITANFAAG